MLNLSLLIIMNLMINFVVNIGIEIMLIFLGFGLL